MSRIDTSKWGDFKVGDLFDAERGKVKNLQNQNKGSTPVIAAGGFNQGIAGMYNVPAIYENKITVSCNGAGCGSVFYHPYKFNLNGDAIVLTELQPMSDLTKQFISCMLNGVLTRKYSYAEKCSADKAKNEIIKLPIVDDGTPDFLYMDSYMKNIENAINYSLSNLKVANNSFVPQKIDIEKWKLFNISDLFYVQKGKRLTKADMKEGKIRFIGASAVNNGITAHISNDEHIHPKNTITLSYNGSVGEAFYQEERFWASDDVNILYPKFEMNREIAFFIIPLLKTAGKRYAFIDKWKKEDMEKSKIPLPVDNEDNPDYKYMESYIIDKLRKNEKALNELTAYI